MAQRTTSDEIIEIIREMPGVTTHDISELMPHVKRRTIIPTLSYLFAKGEVTREELRSENNRKMFKYFINPDPKPVAREPKRKQPTEVAWHARVAELEAEISELRAWKRAAIERFPDLDVDPIVIEARKIVAEETRATDPALADQVLRGLKDNMLPMRVTIAALSR